MDKALPYSNSLSRQAYLRTPLNMASWKFYIVTFGCKVNQYESQALRESWQKLGGRECDFVSEADIICINSCAVTAKGERDARNAIFRLRRQAPTARLILTGCAAGLYKNFKGIPGREHVEPDMLVLQEEKHCLLRDPWLNQDTSSPAPTAFPPFAIDSFQRARPVLKVQDGCSRHCTYCIVPLTRGKPVSRPFQDVLDEAARLLRAGHVEIMLSGVNLSQYTLDKTDDFWELLYRLDKELTPEFGNSARLRLSSLDPSQLNARGLDVLAACKMVCPHLHISLQHTSPGILKRMGRGHYTAKALHDAVHSLRGVWPVMGLGADILVGFPGEKDEDIEHLLACIDSLGLSYAHVFPYSQRPGTRAATYGGQLDADVKAARAGRVRTAVNHSHRRFLEAQLALPRMFVAPDISHDKQKDLPCANEESKIRCKGVNEYYVLCHLNLQPTDSHGLLAVRPTGLAHKGLTVERL